jgi:hypothetical protein
MMLKEKQSTEDEFLFSRINKATRDLADPLVGASGPGAPGEW